MVLATNHSTAPGEGKAGGNGDVGQPGRGRPRGQEDTVSQPRGEHQAGPPPSAPALP